MSFTTFADMESYPNSGYYPSGKTVCRDVSLSSKNEDINITYSSRTPSSVITVIIHASSLPRSILKVGLDKTYIPNANHSQIIETANVLKEAQQNLIKMIDAYLSFSENWDGYGGKTPSKKTVVDTKEFLKLLANDICLPYSGLSGDGEISLFWNKSGIFIDIGFTGNGKYTYYARDFNGKEFFGDDIQIASTIQDDLIRILKTIT